MLKIGSVVFNPEFFKDWSFDQFKEFYKIAGYERDTGEKPEKLAKKLGISIPDSTTKGEGE